eukprot:3072896-Rhodomonas_salina.1
MGLPSVCAEALPCVCAETAAKATKIEKSRRACLQISVGARESDSMMLWAGVRGGAIATCSLGAMEEQQRDFRPLSPHNSLL